MRLGRDRMSASGAKRTFPVSACPVRSAHCRGLPKLFARQNKGTFVGQSQPRCQCVSHLPQWPENKPLGAGCPRKKKARLLAQRQ